VLLKIGPYGAYIESGETRSTLPKKIELRTLDFATALQYLELPRCVYSTVLQRLFNGCQLLCSADISYATVVALATAALQC
jgi:Topoisomerase C-terminal repeat